jgi:alpha-amylase
LSAAYRTTCEGDEKKRTHFGIQFNINLLAGDALDRYYDIPGHLLEDRKLASTGQCTDVSEVHLIDEWNRLKVVLRVDRKSRFWRFPVETVSLSESGFEKIFQGSCLFFFWPLELERGGPFEVTMEMGIESLSRVNVNS